MKTTTKQIFTKLFIGIFAVVLSIASLGILRFSKQDLEHVFAETLPQTVNITNSNFNENTRTSYPYNPTGFTAPDENETEENGVVNLKDNNSKNKFYNANYAAYLTDPYVLRIRGGHGNANFGYTTSSNPRLEADSFYELSVWFLTNVDSGIATIIVYDADNKVGQSQFKTLAANEKLASYNDWTECKFYIKTDAIAAQNINIGLNVAGEGVVYYDNISLKKVDKASFTNDYSNASSDPDFGYLHKMVDLSQDNLLEEFKLTNDSLTQTEQYGKSENLTTDLTTDLDNGTGVNALLIKSTSKVGSCFKINNNINVKKNHIIKISVYARVDNLSSGGVASFMLKDCETDTSKQKNSDAITISSNSKEYQKYSFYVRAMADADKTFNIEVSLGGKDSLTSGEIYISKITISSITYAQFDSVSESNYKKLNLFDSSIAETFLTNGNFDAMQITDSKNIYPATANDWTVSTGDGEQYYGVVSTDTKEFEQITNKLKISNPAPDGSFGNVLMMYTDKDAISYKSASKSISVGEYHEFSLDVLPSSAVTTISLVASTDNDNVTLAKLNVQPSNKVQHTTILIYSPYQNLDVALSVGIEKANGVAYSFVDNAQFDYIKPNKTKFDNAENGELTQKVDLSNLLKANSADDFAELSYFTKSSYNQNIKSGLVNVNNTAALYDENQLEILRQVKGETKNVVAIYADSDTNFKLTSQLGFTLNSGDDGYYKFSVDVYTPILTSEQDVEDKEIGARIALSGFDNNFEKIRATDDWQTYTFYINPTSTLENCRITLGLGDENVAVSGRVFFGNFDFSPISKEDFDGVAAGDNVIVLKDTNVTPEDDTNQDETDAETEENSANRNWIYFIPSILFAAAIIICVVGVLTRKVKIKPHKKVKNAYDRNKTVSVQYYTRKATTMREEKARELEKEIEELSKQRATFEEEYKQNLTKLRELKIKGASASEISKIDKVMKTNKKNSSAIGLNISRVESELDYVKSEAYLISLTKKLSNEAAKSNKEQVKEDADEDNKK